MKASRWIRLDVAFRGFAQHSCRGQCCWENDAGAFRVGAGKGKVDDGAGFTFADDRQFALDVSMALMRENLVNAQTLGPDRQGLIDFEGWFGC